MRSLTRFGSFAIALSFAAVAWADDPELTRPAPAQSTIAGELVVNDASPNQFRIVGYSGMFNAPAGMSIEALDGKPVELSLGSNRQVLRIDEKHMDFAPVGHSVDIVRGQLIPRGGSSFAIAGEDRMYTAPAHVALHRYTNRLVEIRVDETGQVTQMNLISQSADAPPPRKISPPDLGACRYHEQTYSDGSALCQSGVQFRCEAGAWRNQGTVCLSD